MSRVLLVLPSATYRAPDFTAAAAKVGAEVVVASDRRQALASVMGERAVTVDLRDPERAAQQIVDVAARLPLDAVVGVDDQGVLVAALASAHLALRHNPPDAVSSTRNKAVQRAAFTRAGLPQPRFRLAEEGRVAAQADAVGFPCVVKPLGLSGSQGVIRVDDGAAAAAAERRIRAIVAAEGGDRHGPLLVEQFLAGAEVAVEALLRNGRTEVLAVFDKPDPLDGPYFEETLYVTPSRLPQAVQHKVEQATAAAAGALGLVDGPVHAELRICPQPVVLELAARSIGGLCSRALRFGAGVSLEELLLRHALGLPLDGLRRERAAGGVLMVPIPRAGILRRVGGQQSALAVPGVVGLDVAVAPGRAVQPLPEGNRYLGFVFARGDTPEQVEAALRAAHERLDVVIDPQEHSCASC